MTTTRGLLLCACAVLAVALPRSRASGGLDVGVTEDAGKTGDGGATFFATLNDVGLKVNRVSINWDAAEPDDDRRAGPRSPPGCRRPRPRARGSSSPSRR